MDNDLVIGNFMTPNGKKPGIAMAIPGDSFAFPTRIQLFNTHQQCREHTGFDQEANERKENNRQKVGKGIIAYRRKNLRLAG